MITFLSSLPTLAQQVQNQPLFLLQKSLISGSTAAYSDPSAGSSDQQPPQPAANPPGHQEPQPHGFVFRSLKRGLQDQKELYSAPFKPSNLKWDALFLAGTGALLATDKRIEPHVSSAHLDLSRNASNLTLGATAAAVGGIWLYGLKKSDDHAQETGELEVEALANTFLVYTPMQFIAGRERPDEGLGHGRFWQHPGFNSSFPGGHAMFTWTMASVVAHEYPKPWVEVLAYGAATTVSIERFTGRKHFASDIMVGSVLGYLIGTHIFHSHCKEGLSRACHR